MEEQKEKPSPQISTPLKNTLGISGEAREVEKTEPTINAT